MSDDEEVKLYPRGAIALGSGNLVQVTNVKLDHKNNGKLVHTIARSPSGIARGVNDTTLSFDAVVDEDGFERDYLKQVMAGEIKEYRLKVPGETLSVKGMPTSRSLEIPMDGEVKYSVEIIGKLRKS